MYFFVAAMAMTGNGMLSTSSPLPPRVKPVKDRSSSRYNDLSK